MLSSEPWRAAPLSQPVFSETGSVLVAQVLYRKAALLARRHASRFTYEHLLDILVLTDIHTGYLLHCLGEDLASLGVDLGLSQSLATLVVAALPFLPIPPQRVRLCIDQND